MLHVYLDNTIGHDIHFVFPHCPPLFPVQVLLIIPYTQGFEAGPKFPIQRMPPLHLLGGGGVVTGTPQESWWPLDDTGRTLHTEVLPPVYWGYLGGTSMNLKVANATQMTCNLCCTHAHVASLFHMLFSVWLE